MLLLGQIRFDSQALSWIYNCCRNYPSPTFPYSCLVMELRQALEEDRLGEILT